MCLSLFRTVIFNEIQNVCRGPPFLMFVEWRWDAFVRFVDICGIVDHHCLNVLFWTVWDFFFKFKIEIFVSCIATIVKYAIFFLSQLGGRGRDRIVVRCTTTSAISAYHHLRCKFESRSLRDVLDTTLCDRVYQWLTEGRWFSPRPAVSSTNKT